MKRVKCPICKRERYVMEWIKIAYCKVCMEELREVEDDGGRKEKKQKS